MTMQRHGKQSKKKSQEKSPTLQMRRPESSDDRHVMAKHASIYPTEEELQRFQNIVSSCEKALKLVSDQIAESDAPKKKNDAKNAVGTGENDGENKEVPKKEETVPRALKGVMRVGVLAKGLLLQGDTNVQLVVLCSDKPTKTLLKKVHTLLPKQLASVTEEKYELKLCINEASIIVSSVEKDPKISCTITITSPVIREPPPVKPEPGGKKPKEPADLLNKQKCLEALAVLRHAKWFQARATGLTSCVVVLRILRELCQRNNVWAPLNEWAMELLVEKCISSVGFNLGPGDALRRVVECLASGILLPDGPGLYDPCEKETTDVLNTLTLQDKENITASAQHTLRLIAFRQIHQVLNMEQLPMPRFRRKNFKPRKRKRAGDGDAVADEGGEEESKKDKRDVEDGEGGEGGGGKEPTPQSTDA